MIKDIVKHEITKGMLLAASGFLIMYVSENATLTPSYWSDHKAVTDILGLIIYSIGGYRLLRLIIKPLIKDLKAKRSRD